MLVIQIFFQLNNIKVEQLYSQIVTLKDKGYSATQVLDLIKRLTLSKLAFISVKPITEHFDVLLSAIDHDYSIEDSYDLSMADAEFANMGHCRMLGSDNGSGLLCYLPGNGKDDG